MTQTGVITGKKAGKTTITVETQNGKTAKVKVYVSKAPNKPIFKYLSVFSLFIFTPLMVFGLAEVRSIFVLFRFLQTVVLFQICRSSPDWVALPAIRRT